jgi:hypothetical protein
VAQRAAAAALQGRETKPRPIQRKAEKPANATGLPDGLKAGVEALSGFSMDDVKVHYGSGAPARLGAAAYTQGSEIHVGPGQERHLAHEAWHVVQQKQGRVKPTLQMKGIDVNDDCGLEREADRMGAAASALPIEPAPGELEQAPAVGRVVQGVLSYLGHVIQPVNPPDDPVRPALASLRDSADTYYIRDDWDVSNHGVIHILHGTAKYLLGEEHGSGAWEDETAQWTQIRKMSEFEHMMPEAAAAAPVPGHALPLESNHAFLMGAALMLHDNLNGIMALGAAPPADLTDEVLFFVNQIRSAFQDYDNLVTPARAAGGLNPQMTLIATFRDHFEATFLPAANRLRVEFTAIKAGNPAAGWAGRVNADRAFLPDMARELRTIVGIAAHSQQGQRVEGVAASNQMVAADVLTAAVDPPREKAMAANINGAPAPLLVQVGDQHVLPLTKLVGDAVGLRKEEMLADVTALDLGA